MATVIPIIAENWKMDGGACFGVVPKFIWSKLIEVDNDNLISVTSRCMLVKADSQIILFDTGMGNKKSERFYGHYFLYGDENLERNLMKAGISPDEITDIVFTHLHWDHVGGASCYDADGNLKQTFKNASYHCSKTGWEWANNPNPREAKAFFKEDLSPLLESGKLNLIESEGFFNKDIYLRIFDGHTIGQIVPIIKTPNGKCAFTADFIVSSVHIPLAYIPSQDIQPLVTLKEKEDFLNEAIENDYILFFGHDYYTECARLKRTEKGIVAGKSFLWNELNNQK